MFNFKNLFVYISLLILVSCSGTDGDSLPPLEVSISSSNEAPFYDETYTISWESNASQCYAASNTGSWLGELPPSGSQDFVAKREGVSNYGIQCRRSINFENAIVDVVVEKDFINYFDYEDIPVLNIGSLTLDSDSVLEVLDSSIADFNGDFRLDLAVLIEDSKTDATTESVFYILVFYGQDFSSVTEENPYSFQEVNQGNCVANKLIRVDYNQDGLLDLMTVSTSAEDSLNKRGLCFFLSSLDGLTLQDEEYLSNETALNLSNVEIGSNVLYDISGDSRPDVLLFGNGGSTDLPFYVIPSEDGPSISLSNPLNTLDPYTRTNGCEEGISFLCDWITNDYHFKDSIIINADEDGVVDIINSINTVNGPKYNLYNTRLENETAYFDFSAQVEDYIVSSISTGDGISLKMGPVDGNLDGYTDLLVFEKSLSNETYKVSIYEKIVSVEDSVNYISSVNNGDLSEEYTFDEGLRFSNEILVFDLDSNGLIDIFLPFTELPYKTTNTNYEKHFFAYEKSRIVNEDTTTTQDWIFQDFSDSIGLDPSSISNFWIDLDTDNDIDAILMIPEVSSDGINVNYNFKIYLNNSLF